MAFLKIVTDHEELPHPIVTISRVCYEFLSQLWRNTTLHTRGHWCYNIFWLLLVTAAATHRTLTPGPRRPVDRSPCVRTVQMYTRRYLHCAVQLPALYTVHHPHTRRSSSSCGGMQGGDVFEFIINCMSLLNIAHARHCPHRSR